MVMSRRSYLCVQDPATLTHTGGSRAAASLGRGPIHDVMAAQWMRAHASYVGVIVVGAEIRTGTLPGKM